MSDFPVRVDWGNRSEALRGLHARQRSQRSFLLVKAPLPVSLGALTASQASAWDAATPTPLPVTPVGGTYTATAAVPDNTTHIRLDFALRVTIGTATATCLEFRQLFQVGTGGSLLPSQYSFQDVSFTPGPGGPVRAAGPGAPPRRAFLGTCPLVSVVAATVRVNCEFLDVTELWWANWATRDGWGWYLDPDLGGRQELLRVLAWTSGTAPMIWFVAISDQAMNGRGRTVGDMARETAAAHGGGPRPVQVGPKRPGADIVFFRAPAGFNSFFYTSDEKGFLDARHGDTTLFHLARWMLSPLPQPQFAAKKRKVGTARLPFDVDKTGIRIQPVKPAPAIEPKDPIDSIQLDFRWAFRPVGVEGALSRSPSPDIAFLPLGFDGFGGPNGPWLQGGYTTLLRREALLDVIRSARALLWVRGALGRDLKATPPFDRQLWLLANSAANSSLFACLRNNARDVDRVVSCDATPARTLLLPIGVPTVAGAADRAGTGKTLQVICVTTPNMWTDKTQYLAIEKQMLGTKADLRMLPPDGEWDAYWTYPPTATTNAHVFETLREWDGNGLSASRRFGTIKPPPPGQTLQWLFWHEWSVDGGHLVFGPDGKTVDHVRTFIEDALNIV